jgi:hypothetical protein
LPVKRAGTVQKDSVLLSSHGWTAQQKRGYTIITRSVQTRESAIAARASVRAFLDSKAKVVDANLAQVIALVMERVSS